jgi:hypothetical protein
MMLKTKILFCAAIIFLLGGCASNQYPVTYDTDPKGAQLYCNGVAQGHTPVTLYYDIDSERRKRGVLWIAPCSVKWVSGASVEPTDSAIPIDLVKFPNGVVTTVPRPNVDGYSQDAEFALKVMSLKATERAANTAAQVPIFTGSQNSNTVNCKKMGEFINIEIKTFSGMVCPLGWVPAY